MKSAAFSSILIVLLGASFIAPLISAKHSKRSRKARFISFDSDGGKIDIDLDLSVPFLSIPLDNSPGADGSPGTLVNVNTKAITVAGLMAAVVAFIVPLFFKTPHGEHYRLDDDFSFWEMGNSVNNLLLGNKQVTPCIQRAVCAVVSRVARVDSPTSNDKIIDGITSHRWFKSVTNGTAIQEAVTIGREGNRDCSSIYNGCMMPTRILDNILDQYGGF